MSRLSRAFTPVFLHHGIFGFDELRLGPVRIAQFPGIPAALDAAGHPTFLTRVHPTASVASRAAQLKASILRQLPPDTDRVVLIAHSMGGLDARYMISHLGMHSHVAALLTVTTPHRGASLADFCQKHLNSRHWRLYERLCKLGLDVSAGQDLTRASLARFNEETPDHPDVSYYSITCSVPTTCLIGKYVLSHRLISTEEGPNDGIVSVASATWGTLLDHWEVDHITAVNRPPLAFLRKGRRDIPARYVAAVRRIAQATNLTHVR